MIDVNAALPELPPEVVCQLEIGRPNASKVFGYGELRETVIDLLLEHGSLTTNEFIVAIWQRKGEAYPRKALNNALHRFSVNGDIERVGVAKYMHRKRTGIPASFRDPFQRPRR